MIRSFYIAGPAGRLEALLNQGKPEATHAALVCHPHPLHGGTMHNKVVFHAMKALHGFGFPALRFNFRGAGQSAGAHDEGRGERDDVRAALDWLEREFPLPIVFAGFSFGAAVGLRVACADDRVVAAISLGTPVRVQAGDDVREYAYSFLRECRKPKLFLSGDQDPYGPRAELEAVIAQAAEPKELRFIEGSGHFFESKLADMRHSLEHWVRSTLR